MSGAEAGATRLDRSEAFRRLHEAVAALGVARKGRLEEDDFGDARYALRLSLTQLDADAMNDRLQAFVAREAAPRVEGTSAGVSYQHARPDSADDPDHDVEAYWHDVEPFFRLDFHYHPATRERVAAWAALLPRFHLVVDARGRPEGWRPDVHEGSSE